MFLPANITLQFGDSGDFVSELQRRLAAIDAHPGDAINGFYDGVTVNSVSGFQSRSGIRADGIAGPETLRRLNGVASGDTSTTSDNKTEEEEKNIAAEQSIREHMLVDQAQASIHTPMMAQQAVEVAAAATVAEAATAQYAAAAQPQTVDVQQQIQQQNREILHQQAVAHQQQPQQQQISGDMLAQMLLQQSQAASPVPPAREEPVKQAAPTPPIPQPAQQAQAAAPDQQQQQAHQQEQAQPKGVVGRMMQKMDAFMQKIAEHMEAKLPPHVLQQVHQAGEVMARSGVQNVGIPTGPELGVGIQTPARGPEQQQGQLR